MTSATEDGEASFSSKEELALLLQGHEPLYAVLDAAQAPAVLKLLQSSGEEMRSLYNGRRSEQLAGKLQERYGLAQDEAERQARDFRTRHNWH